MEEEQEMEIQEEMEDAAVEAALDILLKQEVVVLQLVALAPTQEVELT